MILTLIGILKDLFINQSRSSFGDFLRPNLCRTALFRNSFFNRIVYLWNQLPNDIKLSVSIPKSKLFSYYMQ